MLRSFLLSILLFTALISSAQNDSLTKMLAHTVCDCFEGVRTAGTINEDAFGECIAGAMEEKNDLVMQELQKTKYNGIKNNKVLWRVMRA